MIWLIVAAALVLYFGIHWFLAGRVEGWAEAEEAKREARRNRH